MLFTNVFVPRIIQLSKMSTNILVYSNAVLKAVVQSAVSPDHYTVYEINQSDIKLTNWHKSCTLAVTTSLDVESFSHFKSYVEKGGKMLCICEDLIGEQLTNNCTYLMIKRDLWEKEAVLREKIKEVLPSLGIFVANPAVSDCFQVSKLSVLGRHDVLDVFDSFSPTTSELDGALFSWSTYNRHLRTRELGRSLVFGEVVTSTMDVAEKVKNGLNGVTIVAHSQVQGQGRSGNRWISPKGAALFTVKLAKKIKSFDPSRLTLLQHAAALSVVSALRQKRGCENFPFAVKWPNDIYLAGQKVGGVLVRSSLASEWISCSIGVGVNLANPAPTVSVNQHLLNAGVTPLDIEEFIAEVLNHLEVIVDGLERGLISTFKDLYYKYWMHSHTNVVFQSLDGVKVAGIITGIDDYGFLEIKTRDGSIVTVQPDGNTFDIMEGLIAPKFSPALQRQ